MIVRTRKDLEALGSIVSEKKWSSARYILKRDGVGFSLHDTTVEEGSEQVLWYKHHLEVCLLLEGEAEIEVMATGKKHRLFPGTCYALDQHERHVFRARTRCRMICVFNPPCTGQEIHDPDGSFPLLQ
jgi:L-ectoine synthase